MLQRSMRHLAVLLFVSGSLSGIACKKEEPPPTPTVTDDEDEKPKKKKKKTDDDEATPDVGAPTEATTGTNTGTLKPPTAKADAGKTGTDADKAKLAACCTALRNTATAVGIAGDAAAGVVPGLPPPPPKEELDKAVKACDEAVINWSGDLNESLKKVKGASATKLPTACYGG